MLNTVKDKAGLVAEQGLEAVNHLMQKLRLHQVSRELITEERERIDRILAMCDALANEIVVKGEPLTWDAGEQSALLTVEDKKIVAKISAASEKHVIASDLFWRGKHRLGLARQQGSPLAEDRLINSSQLNAEFSALIKVVERWRDIYGMANDWRDDEIDFVLRSLCALLDLFRYQHSEVVSRITTLNEAQKQLEGLAKTLTPAMRLWLSVTSLDRACKELAEDVMWMYERLHSEKPQRGRGAARRAKRALVQAPVTESPDYRFRLARAMKNLKAINKDHQIRLVFAADSAAARFRDAKARYESLGGSFGVRVGGVHHQASTDLVTIQEAVSHNADVQLSEVLTNFAPQIEYDQIFVSRNDTGRTVKHLMKARFNILPSQQVGLSFVPLYGLLNDLQARAWQVISDRHLLPLESETPKDGPATRELYRTIGNYTRFRLFRRHVSKGKPSLFHEPVEWQLLHWSNAKGAYQNLGDITVLDALKQNHLGLFRIKPLLPAPIRLADLFDAIAIMELASPGINIVHAQGVKRVLDFKHPGNYDRLIERYKGFEVYRSNKPAGSRDPMIDGPLLKKVYRLGH